MERVDGRNDKNGPISHSGAAPRTNQTALGSENSKTSIPLSPSLWNHARAEWRSGWFYKSFSAGAMSEFESLAAPYFCDGKSVLFAEGQERSNVLFLLEGKVKITMNLIEGKRLTLGYARPGELLGLVSVLSGCPSEFTAVAMFPCIITSLPRKDFVDFLLRYPVASRNSARLLSEEYERCCEQMLMNNFA
jgi:hypothetical protein